MEDISKCLLCGSSLLSVLFHKLDLGINAQILKCFNCDIVFIYPQAEENANLNDYYQNSVEPSPADNKRFLKRIERIKLLKKMLLFLRRFFARRIPLPRGEKKILDIGCGTGLYLALLRELGWQVQGVEVNKSAVEYAKKSGIDVFCGNLEEAGFPSEYFDFVRIVQVIEHIEHPCRTLEEIKRILKPGGIVYLEVPNSKSWAFKCFKEKWLNVGGHLYSFSSCSLDFICSRLNLQIIKTSYKSSKGITLSSVRYALENKPFFQKLILRNKTMGDIAVKLTRLFLASVHRADTLVVEAIKKP